MPYAIHKIASHYQVVNKDTGHIYAYHTTKENAVKQVKLLHMLERKK